MKTLTAAALVFLALAGCAVHTPSGSVVVDPARAGGSGQDGFCPPGQAKKGRC